MNYYNEFDPFAAAWLRELIKAGLIPNGYVDERDIRDVNPNQLRNRYTQCHFFAGIGGWPYALQLAGWPSDRPVWTGSCPCQPFSQAGKGEGEKDSRHLWPELRRLIAECNPTAVFGEQVASADGRVWLDRVRLDLEGLGYAVGAADLCAASVGAPHIRQRLFWVADARCAPTRRLDTGASSEAHTSKTGRSDRRKSDQFMRRCGDNGMEHAKGDGWQQRGTESGRGSIVGGCSDRNDARGVGHPVIADAACVVTGVGGEGISEGAGSGRNGLAIDSGISQLPPSIAFGVNRLANSERDGGGQYVEEWETEGGAIDRGDCQGLGHAECDGRGAGRRTDAIEPNQSNNGAVFAASCTVGGLVNSNGAGCGEYRGAEPVQSEFGRVERSGRESWADYIIVPCADGKTRRLKPGLSPLVNGFSGRVGALRGYGNAIVPQVAAEFIRAYLETEGGLV